MAYATITADDIEIQHHNTCVKNDYRLIHRNNVFYVIIIKIVTDIDLF